MSHWEKKLWVLLLCFYFGCSTNSNTKGLIPQISFTGSEEEKVDAVIEPIHQNNCGGSAEVENVEQRAYVVSYKVQAGGAFQVNANGQVGFAGTGIDLGAQVAQQLGVEYGREHQESKSITVKAAAGTNMVHEIELREIWKIGKAKVSVNGKELEIPFRFRHDFRLFLKKSARQSCGNTEVLSLPQEPSKSSITTSAKQSKAPPSPATLPKRQVVINPDAEPTPHPDVVAIGWASGIVQDANSYDSVEGAKIKIVNERTGRVYQTSTREDGRFEIAVPVGAYSITASHVRYAEETQHQRVQYGTTTGAVLWRLVSAKK
jgi:hypothetical protein